MKHDSNSSSYGLSSDVETDDSAASRNNSTSSLFESDIEHDAEISGEIKASKGSIFSGIPPSVWFVYLHLVTVVTANTCSGPVTVLYFNLRHWTTRDDVLFYTICTFVGTLMPVLFNPVFGFWQGRRSTKELFLFDALGSGYGFLIMAVASDRWLFFAGYCLSRISLCQRATRTTYILRTTSAEVRTQASSLIPVFALLGALIGPLFTMLCTLSGWYQFQDLLINPYTLTYWVSCFLCFIRIPMMLFFAEERFSDRSTSSKSSDDSEIQIYHQKQKSRNTWLWFFYFAALNLFGNLSIGIYTLTLQPILVNYYKFSQTDIVATMIPPIVSGILSKQYGIADRYFLFIGLLGIILGLLIYSFPPGELGLTIAGVLITFPFTAVFGPTAASLFTKLVGSENASALKMGLLASATAFGSAVGSIIGGQAALENYGSDSFLYWLIPILICIPLILFAWFKLLPSVSPPVHPAINASRQTADENRALLEKE